MKSFIKTKLHIGRRGLSVAGFLLYDILAVIVCQFLALYIRFDFSFPKAAYMENAVKYMLINIAVTLAVFKLLQLYNSLWRFASVRELCMICAAVLIVSLIQPAGMMVLGFSMPRSYYFLYFFFDLTAVIGSRFAYRFIRIVVHDRFLKKEKTRNIMMIGAGDAGIMLLKELSYSYRVRYHAVCIIDDDRAKTGTKMLGVPVIGGREKIAEAVVSYGVEEIIIAIPTLTPAERRELVTLCNATGCYVRILPGIFQIVNNEVSVSNLREVQIEDLLGREPVCTDACEVASYVKDRTVLVTGGGGSIGSEICRQVAENEPKKLILLDIYENSAYDIQLELKRKYLDIDLEVLIGSVRDKHYIDKLFETYRPDIVYHAAAHKHVPLMEASPNEAVKNNVMGTYHVASAADRYGAKRFVLISTDKAVNPTNIMGASKRLCEKVIQSLDAESRTEFVAVRFGNVLGSNGSVVPLFKQQIAMGGPVTVTHKEITRYFMTIPEAVSLVMQAGAYAKGGEIFVLDMGEQVKIDDLARNMIRLSGLEPDRDIKIVYTGLRPGEKLFEEKMMAEEGLRKTANERIFIGQPLDFDRNLFLAKLEELEALANEDRMDDAIYRKVKEMAPTFLWTAKESRDDKVLEWENAKTGVGKKLLPTAGEKIYKAEKKTYEKAGKQIILKLPDDARRRAAVHDRSI